MTWKTFAAEVGEQPAPGFALLSHQGRTVRREDYRQKAPLVLYFGHNASCQACLAGLRRLAGRYAELREHEAEVLALLAEGTTGVQAVAQALAVPFPLLADAQGNAVTAYAPLLGQPGPGLALLDRFGAPRATYAGHIDDEVVDEALRWLALMSYECPE